jgi:hypothetical protein
MTISPSGQSELRNLIQGLNLKQLQAETSRKYTITYKHIQLLSKENSNDSTNKRNNEQM